MDGITTADHNKMEHSEITERIIGCAYEVYNTMGFGFLESVYETALAIELQRRGLSVKRQYNTAVYYKDEIAGEFRCDLLIDHSVIVELKSVTALAREHEVQLVNDLVATGKDVGLLVNFGRDGVDVRRKVRDLGRCLAEAKAIGASPPQSAAPSPMADEEHPVNPVDPVQQP